MKWILAVALTISSLAPVAAVHAQSARHGVVLGLQPIENRGDDESQTHKEGRKWGGVVGNFLGMKALSNTNNGQVANVVGNTVPAAGEMVGGQIAGNGPSAHYMVKVKLDDGKVVALVRPGQEVSALHEGSRVAVSGSGETASIVAE